MQKYFKNINYLILIFFTAYIFKLGIHQIYSFSNPSQTNYMYSNWLINYRGGFVRRGLNGEIILRLSSILDISPLHTIYMFTALAWIVLTCFFVFHFIQKKHSLFILVLPFFLGETIIIDSSHILRQDSLIMLFFIAITTVFFSKRIFSEICRFLIVNILFMLGILCHEVIFFFSFPILLISYQHKNHSLLKSTIFLLPSTIAFILSFMLPTKENVLKMLTLTPEIHPYFVRFLQTSFSQNMQELWERISSTGLLFTLLYFVYWVLSVFFVSVNFGKLQINLNNNSTTDSKFMSQILLVQFLSMLPVFCTAWDWGRWIFLWTTSSFAYFLIADENSFDKIPLLSKFDLKNSRIFNGLSKKPNFVFLVAIIINCQFILPLQKDFFHNAPVFSVYCMVKNAVLYTKGLFF